MICTEDSWQHIYSGWRQENNLLTMNLLYVLTAQEKYIQIQYNINWIP